MTFNIKVDEKTEQPLMSRTVLKGLVSYDTVPPSFVELKKKLAESMKLDESLVVVKSISPEFGVRQSDMEAHLYKTKNDMDMFCSKVILARNKPRAKKKAGSSEGED